MTMVVPNNGEGDALGYFVNKQSPQDLVLRLYKSNTTPAETDTAGSYTEADFTGYSSVSLTGASWTLTEGAPSHADYAQQSFTSSAGSQNQDVYGWYATRTTSGRIACAERFATAPWNIANNGDKIQVTPVITAD